MMTTSALVQYGISDCSTSVNYEAPGGYISTLTKTKNDFIPNYHHTYSRKVFLGGLPPDIDEDGIKEAFWKFGTFEVYWPGKHHNPKCLFPPKGYAFLQFEIEAFVHRLVQGCIQVSDGGLFYMVSSPSVNNKVIQVKPWRLEDAVTITNESFFSRNQFAVFVGGVPRTLTSAGLARHASNAFGNVSYTEIYLDHTMGYPKGSGVVCFSNFNSFVSAISRNYLEVVIGGFVKHVELKPYYNRW
ncbi:unnamed protein product [Orchesella dallaii]|uniref:RRM domain-containing protein n=1 Tax=Orchesella dallaii TaxID=48710 RepID=A0ABP1QSP0_9HEXA